MSLRGVLRRSNLKSQNTGLPRSRWSLSDASIGAGAMTIFLVLPLFLSCPASTDWDNPCDIDGDNFDPIACAEMQDDGDGNGGDGCSFCVIVVDNDGGAGLSGATITIHSDYVDIDGESNTVPAGTAEGCVDFDVDTSDIQYYATVSHAGYNTWTSEDRVWGCHPNMFEVRLTATGTAAGAPTANAGPDQADVPVWSWVDLDGSGSSDPDGDMLDFSWDFISAPSGNTAPIRDADTEYPYFQPMLTGTYEVELTVWDGEYGDTDTVVITVVDSGGGGEAPPEFQDDFIWDDGDWETGYGITISSSGIFVVGDSGMGGGILLKYMNPPIGGPTWYEYWGSDVNDDFRDVREVGTNNMYIAGASYDYSTDTSGGKEQKGCMARFNPPTSFPNWYTCPVVMSYSGVEFYNAFTSDGTYLYATGAAQANSSNNTAMLSKIDETTGEIWTRFFTSQDASRGGGGNDIVLMSGELYITGAYNDGMTLRAITARYNTSGVQNWVEHYTDALVSASSGEGIATDGSFLYVVGRASESGDNDVLILKYDMSGTLIWESQWGGTGDDRGFAAVYSDGRLYITGTTTSYGSGNADVALLAVDPASGEVLAETYWGGGGDDIARDITMDGDNIYITGDTLSYGSDTDIFILWYQK